MGFGDKSKKEKQAEASAAASVFSSLHRSTVQDRRIAILVKTPALVHCCHLSENWREFEQNVWPEKTDQDVNRQTAVNGSLHKLSSLRSDGFQIL